MCSAGVCVCVRKRKALSCQWLDSTCAFPRLPGGRGKHREKTQKSPVTSSPYRLYSVPLHPLLYFLPISIFPLSPLSPDSLSTLSPSFPHSLLFLPLPRVTWVVVTSPSDRRPEVCQPVTGVREPMCVFVCTLGRGG